MGSSTENSISIKYWGVIFNEDIAADFCLFIFKYL